ncbi:uncharacterized protein A4U43_C03F31680 [Asparagus officinalis]|uniref:Uncharacterized protein n=1 Tax=Asparagus officinalis TaxID=4686 RepID=A0A5P1FEG5_ASPOF|nr:uncharacterized protein A4U43_C03F31680 [Asparagus officinalis]
MKLQYLRLAFCDETNILSPSPSPSPSPSLTINCKRLRPIAPKFVPRDADADILTSLDLRSFNSPKPTKRIDQAQNPDASPVGKKEEAKRCDGGSNKRKRGWESDDEGDGTLELFPLRPERD